MLFIDKTGSLWLLLPVFVFITFTCFLRISIVPSPASFSFPSSTSLTFLSLLCPLSSTSSPTHTRFIGIKWRIREHHLPVAFQVSSLIFKVNNSSYSKSISPALTFYPSVLASSRLLCLFRFPFSYHLLEYPSSTFTIISYTSYSSILLILSHYLLHIHSLTHYRLHYFLYSIISHLISYILYYILNLLFSSSSLPYIIYSVFPISFYTILSSCLSSFNNLPISPPHKPHSLYQYIYSLN